MDRASVEMGFQASSFVSSGLRAWGPVPEDVRHQQRQSQCWVLVKKINSSYHNRDLHKKYGFFTMVTEINFLNKNTKSNLVYLAGTISSLPETPLAAACRQCNRDCQLLK